MNQTSNSNPKVKQMTTCFDNGFEVPIKGTNLEPNNYNINGEKCVKCSIVTNCPLKKQNCENLCFEGLHNMLTETNIFNRVQNGENLPELEQAIHENITGMLYLLKTKTKVEPHLMTPWERMDLLTYTVQPSSPLDTYGKKYGAICRMFGRQCMEILRDRGYGFEQ